MLSIDFLLTSLIVVLIPGTGVIYTLSVGIFQGARPSLFAALGCTLGILPSLLASVLGLAAIFHSSALAFQLFKFFGAAYLIYLAWATWKNAGQLGLRDEGARPSLWRISLKGFLINTLNPKLSLFFLAFLPQFVPADAATPLAHMLILGGVFMAMTLLVFMFYGVAANRVREHIIRSPKVTQYLQRAFALSFAALGSKLALSER